VAKRAEARRVHLVIEEFRNQWWNLISEALKQLELRVPSADAPPEQTEMLHDDLRSRLGETRGKDGIQPERTGDSEVESHEEIVRAEGSARDMGDGSGVTI
jgi:hypothetical protein